MCELTDRPKEEEKSVFRELGLPYVADPAITRHLAAFCLGRRRQTRRDSLQRRVLHSRNSPPARRRCIGALVRPPSRNLRKSRPGPGGRRRRRVLFLRPRDRRGPPGPRRIAARLFHRPGRRERRLRTLCLVPRGAEEGSTLELDPGNLQLVTNKPVSFRLYSSRMRTEDHPGDVVEFPPDDADLHLHAPLNAVLRFGKAGERLVPVNSELVSPRSAPSKSGPTRKKASTVGVFNSSSAKRWQKPLRDPPPWSARRHYEPPSR